MNVLFNRVELIDALAPMMGCVATNNILPAIAGVMIVAGANGDVCLTTTDIEKTMRRHVTGVVTEVGSVIVPAAKLLAVAKAMESDDIVLSVNEKNHVKIVSGKSIHEMQGPNPKEFPEFPLRYADGSTDASQLTASTSFEIGQPLLKEAISGVAYAMAVNDTRPVLNGLYLELNMATKELTAVSCDSYKLAIVRRPTDAVIGEQKAGLIIPNKSVRELIKLLDEKDTDHPVRCLASNKHVGFIVGDTVFITMKIAGEYIDFTRIVPRQFAINVMADKDSLEAVLTRVALVAEEKVTGAVQSRVLLDVEGSKMSISSKNVNGSAFDELPITHIGSNVKIAFNSRFLRDTIKACGNVDCINIEMNSARQIIACTPLDADGNATKDIFLVLPVRMLDE